MAAVYCRGMQKITLLCVGSLKIHWITAGCADFLARLRHVCAVDVVEVPASKQKDSSRQAEEESQRLLRVLEKQEGDVWVLDERGKDMSSTAFADALESTRDAGRPLTFVLGGAYGLTDAVRSRAYRMLKLSDMTFPHELCRLIFLEQLYRAHEIRRGSGYHHA